jgi:hypothetical protein
MYLSYKGHSLSERRGNNLGLSFSIVRLVGQVLQRVPVESSPRLQHPRWGRGSVEGKGLPAVSVRRYPHLPAARQAHTRSGVRRVPRRAHFTGGTGTCRKVRFLPPLPPPLPPLFRSNPNVWPVSVPCSVQFVFYFSQSEFNRRERHAKTIEIAQEEVLTCLGICLYERMHRIQQRSCEEELTWEILFCLAVEALQRKFEVCCPSRSQTYLLNSFDTLPWTTYGKLANFSCPPILRSRKTSFSSQLSCLSSSVLGGIKCMRTVVL